ncbi:hypothetical protein D3C75_1305720 [compost metagenome]
MKKVNTPAITPITIAAHGSTNAQEPVIATKAARTPFSMLGISALPNTTQDTNNAATPPAAAAKFVVNAT